MYNNSNPALCTGSHRWTTIEFVELPNLSHCKWSCAPWSDLQANPNLAAFPDAPIRSPSVSLHIQRQQLRLSSQESFLRLRCSNTLSVYPGRSNRADDHKIFTYLDLGGGILIICLGWFRGAIASNIASTSSRDVTLASCAPCTSCKEIVIVPLIVAASWGITALHPRLLVLGSIRPNRNFDCSNLHQRSGVRSKAHQDPGWRS